MSRPAMVILLQDLILQEHISTPKLNITRIIAQFEDENVVSLKDTTSLALVDFEFLPHWNIYSSCLEDLKKYSLEKNNIIYACKDGDGIVVENKEIRFYGDIVKIVNGSLTKI